MSSKNDLRPHLRAGGEIREAGLLAQEAMSITASEAIALERILRWHMSIAPTPLVGSTPLWAKFIQKRDGERLSEGAHAGEALPINNRYPNADAG